MPIDEGKEADNNPRPDIASRKLLQPVRFQHPSSRLENLFIVFVDQKKLYYPSVP